MASGVHKGVRERGTRVAKPAECRGVQARTVRSEDRACVAVIARARGSRILTDCLGCDGAGIGAPGGSEAIPTAPAGRMRAKRCRRILLTPSARTAPDGLGLPGATRLRGCRLPGSPVPEDEKTSHSEVGFEKPPGASRAQGPLSPDLRGRVLREPWWSAATGPAPHGRRPSSWPRRAQLLPRDLVHPQDKPSDDDRGRCIYLLRFTASGESPGHEGG